MAAAIEKNEQNCVKWVQKSQVGMAKNEYTQRADTL